MFVSLVIIFAWRLRIGQKSGTCAAKKIHILGLRPQTSCSAPRPRWGPSPTPSEV